MGANNLYFPSTDRTYSFKKENYIVIDDKETGLPLKINLEQFFKIAYTLNLISSSTSTLQKYEEVIEAEGENFNFTITHNLGTKHVVVNGVGAASVNFSNYTDNTVDVQLNALGPHYITIIG